MKTLILSILVLTTTAISNAQIHSGSFKFEGLNRRYEVYLVKIKLAKTAYVGKAIQAQNLISTGVGAPVNTKSQD